MFSRLRCFCRDDGNALMFLFFSSLGLPTSIEIYAGPRCYWIGLDFVGSSRVEEQNSQSIKCSNFLNFNNRNLMVHSVCLG